LCCILVIFTAFVSYLYHSETFAGMSSLFAVKDFFS
jgi:hypothetical protein